MTTLIYITALILAVGALAFRVAASRVTKRENESMRKHLDLDKDPDDSFGGWFI